MPNIRIVDDNALERAALAASSRASTATPVENLINDWKSSLWRSAAGTTARLEASWTSPETLQAVGMLSNLSPEALWRVRVSGEDTATNLMTRSEELHLTTSAWTRAGGISVVANVTQAPNGAMTADQVIAPTSAVSHYLDYSIQGLADNTIYSGAIYLKRDTLMRAIFALTARDGSSASAEINFEDGRMTRMSNGTGQDCKFKVLPIGGGWYRLFIENFNTLSGATIPRFRLFASQHNEISKSGWVNTSATADRVTDVVSPYPNWGVDKLVELTGNSGHYTTCPISCQTGRTVVLEQTMKALGTGSTRYGAMLLTANSGLAATRWAIINLATGVITAQSGGTECVFSTEDMGNGFWKLVCQFTPDRDGVTSWQIRGTNASNNAAPNYTGDGVSGIYVCKPYAYTLIPVVDWAPFYTGSESSTAGDGATGFYAWGAMFCSGPKMGSYYPSVGTVQGVRPAGYMDDWQSYDHDSGWVRACPAPAARLRRLSPAQAASAYAYGGGAFARHWMPVPTSARRLVVDVSDPGNLQGYIEAPFWIAGRYWEAKKNADYGAEATPADSTKSTRTEGGDLASTQSTRSSKLRFSLTKMDPEDSAKLWNILRANGTGYPVWVSLFPEDQDLQLEAIHQVYGKFMETPSMSRPSFRIASASITIESI